MSILQNVRHEIPLDVMSIHVSRLRCYKLSSDKRWYEFEMPKVRRSKKPPPDGWELIEPTLEELEQKMREGNDKKKIEVME